MKGVLAILGLTTALSAFDATVPVLDLNDYYSETRHEAFVEELAKAFEEVGFFALINADIDQETLDAAYAATKDLFALSDTEKLSLYDPELCGRRGYVPSETAKGRTMKDHKEFYHIGSEDFELENVWPENEKIQADLSTLHVRLSEQAQVLAGAVSEALGSRADLISGMIANSNSVLRALHYPQDTPEGGIWSAEHTDINLFTILPQSTGAGLQVLNKNGEWIDVVTPQGAFVVNCGDMLQNMSNGLFRSSVHRVVEKGEGKDRYSIVFFVHPRYECPVSPLTSAIAKTGGRQLFPNATERQLFSERMADNSLASEEMLKFLAKSGLVEQMIELGKASPDVLDQLAKSGFTWENTE